MIVLRGDERTGAQSSPVGDMQPNIFQESLTIAFGTPTGKNLLKVTPPLVRTPFARRPHEMLERLRIPGLDRQCD